MQLAYRHRNYVAHKPIIVSYFVYDKYYMTYKPITRACISFMFIEMKFIPFHSCVMFAKKSMSICKY